MILAVLSMIYLAVIGIFSHIFRKKIRWIQYVNEKGINNGITPTAKAIWLSIIWPIIIIPVISWYIIKQVTKGE